jgi:transcriptional regulator with XRE-family HTH domain
LVSLMPMLDDKDALAAVLNLALKRAGITQAELARRLGRAPATLQQYRTRVKQGHADMRITTLARWIGACGGRILVELPE